MWIFVDSEGDPIQEFSAIYVDSYTLEILDVFHEYVKYPFKNYDGDKWCRYHVHGLQLDFLSQHGLTDEDELKRKFDTWLSLHPYESIYGHAPYKEETFLHLTIQDVCLKPWKDRRFSVSHQLAISLKKNNISICDVQCVAHNSFKGWLPKKPHSLSSTDIAKIDFLHHCSLYDCIEMYLEFSADNKKKNSKYLC